jgi:hypothetical protein
VAHDWDALDDGALENYLTGSARERNERFVVEERDGEWVAEFRSPNELAGEVLPMGVDAAVILGDENVMLRANGPDRRTAMLRLAQVLANLG